MKVSNEAKIGALTVISVTLLVLGFNFLKGKTVFKTGFFLYARFNDIKKLQPSNPVYVNGFQIGSVHETEAADLSAKSFIVSIKLNEDYHIPDNSVAAINSPALNSPDITISLGNSTHYLQSGDTIKNAVSRGTFEALTDKLGPVADQLTATLGSLDTLLRNFNTVLDPNTKGNLQSGITNLNRATESIVASTASLKTLLNTQTGALAASLGNINSFTRNLAENNNRIDSVLANIETTTNHLSKADIDGVVNQLKSSVDELNAVVEKINSTNGSLGAMINSKDLYNRINNTVTSLNTLMDDIRVHPKRYVSISVFGRKDNGQYLTAPLAKDSSNLSAPQK